jgi:membrane protein
MAIWDLLKETYSEWSNHNATVLSAALAFYAIFSSAPLLIIVMAVVGFILNKELVQAELLQELSRFAGHQNAVTLIDLTRHYFRPGTGIVASIFALSLILLGSTSVFVMLRNALNMMWGIVPHQGTSVLTILKDRLISFGIVLGVGFWIFLSILSASFLAVVNRFFTGLFPIPVILIEIGNILVFLILLSLMFALLFKFLPEVKIPWKDVWVGAVITAALFTLGKYLLGFYLAHSTVSSAYGAAGSLVVLLLWFYYSSLIVFFGAELTQVFSRRYGSRMAPSRRSEE